MAAEANEANHRASVIKASSYFFIQLFLWLVQVNRKRHIRLARRRFRPCARASSSKQALIAIISRTR